MVVIMSGNLCNDQEVLYYHKLNSLCLIYLSILKIIRNIYAGILCENISDIYVIKMA